MKRNRKQPPTDEEVLAQDNVPVDMAAAYIAQSTTTIYFALQQSRAPFGFANQNEATLTWTYNISPGLLVAYKRGQLPMLRLEDIQNIAASGINKIIDQRMAAMDKLLGLLGKVGAA